MPRHNGNRGQNNPNPAPVGNRRQRTLRGLDFGSCLTSGAWIALKYIADITQPHRLHIEDEPTVVQWLETMARACSTIYPQWDTTERSNFSKGLYKVLDQLSEIERRGGGDTRQAAIECFVRLRLSPCLHHTTTFHSFAKEASES